MPVFIDPRSGEVYDSVPDEEADRARREFGLVSQEEYDHQQAVEGADEGFGSAVAGGFQRGLGMIGDALEGFTPPAVGSDAFGAGGPAPMGEPAAAVQSGEETFPGAYDEQARLQREARPFAAGLGTSLAAAPLAAMAGAAAVPGFGAVLGTTVSGVVAEAGVEAVAQEYDDAWFEQRPYDLKNVAANTLAFSGVDFMFRGALKGIGSVFAKDPVKPAGAIGGRNVVSEAQGAAREMVDPVGGGSVGAARAADLEDEFTPAISQMSDSEAATLARDADDHIFLVAQDASESFTRLNNGLSDDLGNQLKYEDIGTYAQEWEAPLLERQAKWATTVSEGAEDGIAAIQQSKYSLGNFGKRAEETLDTFTRRIADEPDAGNRMVALDEFKRRLHRLSKSIDASDLDAIAKEELKSAIIPTRDGLRKGLTDPKLFGGAADLQRSLNVPWTTMLESWSKVQNTLTEATGHIKFDTTGAGRITRESTVDRMFAMAQKDPRRNQEFGKHLGQVFDGLNGLIEARQAHGIARKDGLDALATDVRNLMEDWNLATTIGVAKNRVDAMKRDPRKWATLAANIGERLPIVGQPIQMARGLSAAFTDLNLPKNSALGKVWDRAYRRYAMNPVYSDPAIIRNYPDWIAESLRSRGGRIPPGGSGMMGGTSVPSAPVAAANDVMTGVAQPSPAYQRAKAIIEKRGEAGSVQLSGSVRGKPGFADLPEGAQSSLSHAAMGAPQTAFTKEAKDEVRAGLKANRIISESDRKLALDFVDSIPDELQWNGKLARKYGRLVGRRGEGGEFRDELMRHVEGRLIPDDPMMQRLYHDRKMRDAFLRGVDQGASELEKTGRPLDSSAFRSIKETLAKHDAQSGSVNIGGGPNFSIADVAKSPMGVVAGAGGAGLAINAAVQARAAEPPQSPEVAYRDALLEIDRAGQQQVKTLASEALRKKPSRGKDRDPLVLFAGKRKIQDAVEEARERLDEIAADPTTLLQQVGGSSGELGRTHPSVYMAVTEKAAQVATYLQAVIPQRTVTTLLDPVGAAPSFDRAWDFAARFVGATQPRVALREIVRGAAPPEMLEAVQQNWPELWDGFRAETLGQIQRMHMSGRHIPSEKLRRLDSLLGLRGQLDPTAAPEFTAHMLAAQDAELARRQEGGQASGAVPGGGSGAASFRTRLDAINNERQMG